MKVLAYIVLMLLSLQGMAQSFQAKVSHSHVAIGDHFELKFIIEGKGRKFNPPPLDEFRILGGPNKASQVTMVNGNVSSTVSYSFILSPKREGDIEIAPASIEIDGKTFQTDPIVIHATKGQTKRHANTHPQPVPKPQRQTPPDASLDDQIKSNIFLKLFVDDKDVYVGEQLLATYKLYLNASILDYDFSNLVFNGFYAEDLKVDASKSATQELINGKHFTVYTLKQTLLTPQKSGELEIPPLEMDLVIRVREQRRSRSLFDQMFGNYRNAQVSIESNPEKVKVSPLPAAGQTKQFTGAVGTFNVSAKVDRHDVGTNEAINYTVTIEGQGNLDLIPAPEIEFPTDFEVYEPKVKSQINPTVSGSRGSKSYEYVLIPRFPGEFELKPITFTYFDPKRQAYQKVSSDPITLSIARGDKAGGQNATAYVAPKKEDVQIIGKDIRYIMTEAPNLRRSEEDFFGTTLFYITSTLPFAGMGAAVFLIFFFRANQDDERKVKRKRAKSMAKKHLAKARKRIDGGDEEFYDAISSALFGYVSDKFDIARSELSRERIEETLAAHQVSEGVQQNLKKALDECEMVRFAPGVVRGKEDMLRTSTELIEQLENEV